MVAHSIVAITITAAYKIEGNMVLETDCDSFEKFKSLPAVVSYQGILCSKTGWNSDKNYACYQSRRHLFATF